MTGVVGVLGGSGEVGAAAAGYLAAIGVQVVIGGRRRDAAERVAEAVGPLARACPVDVAHPADLRAFADGCRVVLDCVGSDDALAERVRVAAVTAGADHVDVSSGRPHHAAPPGGRVSVTSAGLYPGLSGLLPGLLAAGLDGVDDFEGAYCGLGVLTEAAARDFLSSMRGGYGTSMAAWRDGRVVPAALAVDKDYRLPQVPGGVVGHPYLTEELRERAEALGIRSARWYNAFDGEHLLAALTRFAQDTPAGTPGPERHEAARVLVRASALDAAGRTPRHLLHARARGASDRGPVERTLVVRGSDGSQLTGVVAAIAAEEVLGGTVAPGAHAASSVLPPEPVLDRLRDHVPDLFMSLTTRLTEPTVAPLSDGRIDGEL